MQHSLKWLMLAVVGAVSLQACSAPPPDPTIPGHAARHAAAQCLTAVVVTSRQVLAGSPGSRFTLVSSPGDTDGGSATPVSDDGYFVTADHVLAQSAGRKVFVVYRNGGDVRLAKARIVWRSYGGDVAVLHAPIRTPYYYQWSSPEKWLPVGTPVIHAGIATGFRSSPGKLSTELTPETPFTGNRKFKIDVPLQPGDSGGPVLDANGDLIGINSAVEYLVPMETAFFIDSECSRPNVRSLAAIIERDRRSPRSKDRRSDS
ncbi:MAG: serine protease [Luteolibacter sp.]